MGLGKHEFVLARFHRFQRILARDENVGISYAQPVETTGK